MKMIKKENIEKWDNKRQRNKIWEKQEMNDTAAHHPLMDAHPIHQQLLTNTPQFIYREWHSIAWNMPLASLDELF